MDHPIIGVPTQTLQAIDGIPEGLPLSWVMNHRYYVALASVGAAPFMIPLLDDHPQLLRSLYEQLDGVFLAGGVDVDPSTYGEPRHERCGNIDVARDRVEMQLARWAIEDGKPLLGVCRGLQIINVALGGRLYQDCETCFTGAIKHDYFPTAGYERDYLAHEIRLEDGSRLREIFGVDSVQVNSMHHQGIRDLGRGLRPSAYAPDGLVEAAEGPNGAFLIGVQWHPEMLSTADTATRRLFLAFADAAEEYRSTRLALA